MPVLERCLADLDSRLDEGVEGENLAQWICFLEGRWNEDLYVPLRSSESAPSVDWPTITVNEAFADTDLMLLRELKMLSDALSSGDGGRVGVRCNYGTGILPSLFGCELFMMEDKADTLPSVRPLVTNDRIRALVDEGVPDIHAALGGAVFETAERFLDVFERYPAIKKHVVIYHPDTQSPADIAELVWGSDIFIAALECPDLLTALLELVTETYIEFMRAWFELVPRASDYTPHWNLIFKGGVMLREDSLTNFSRDMYVELFRPFDQRILDEFGGGAVHFCGKGDHYIDAITEMNGVTGINMTQPEYNDLETVFRHTIDKGIKLLSLNIDVAHSAGRPLRGQVQCELQKGAF